MRIALRSLSRRLALIGALTLLALLTLSLAGLGAPRALAAGSAGAGSISGVAINGTHANAPLAGQQVTLQLSIGSDAKDLASVTTDAQGHFAFGNIDLSGAALGGAYAVYTTFQGGTYATSAINLNTNPTQTTTLTVYDATQDSANLSVSLATILVRQPDVTHGLVGIGEFITIHNSGTTAFVGSLPTNTASGAMPSLVRFSLPANAQNVTTGVGFYNTTIIQIDTGFAAATTVPPGQSEFAFAFDLPYTGSTLSVPYKAEYPTAQVVTLVPNGLRGVTGGAIVSQGDVTAYGAQYHVYAANHVANGGQVSFALAGLPIPGEPQDLNTSHLLWLGGALALLLALLLALYLWRGALATTLGLIPATPPAPSDIQRQPLASASDAERDRLLRELLALERRKASGAIAAEQFKREDAALRERLRASLADEAPAANPPTTSQPAAAGDAEVGVPSGGQR
ncbi:MAG TPA: hypothetical protein VIG77_17150 [Ktedonobacterales bacterium]|jgi:hypothetical protein